ncbi:hypothetical protein K5V21_13800 [Clostridium sardiniense]|uniref:Uncharacterized protein n=1 Tax=Clostridium sardiniense TaxID=29369 RepID=A0ABS7L0C8_CLOSR|nr:hypothetical protein [Clostridium sardiniense]MBY0756519.1 hypothetical protein [Clostridium sardiniense]MDQ0460266.1 cytochrome c-type biogenesis protein CcmE [Clostridium sardiniense]
MRSRKKLNKVIIASVLSLMMVFGIGSTALAASATYSLTPGQSRDFKIEKKNYSDQTIKTSITNLTPSNSKYNIKLYKDGTEIKSKDYSGSNTFSYDVYDAGSYKIKITSNNLSENMYFDTTPKLIDR